jgi:RNA polymerase-binding transcription factor DksA
MECLGCGKTIPAGRLEIFPHTRFCVGCVDKHPQGVSYDYSHVVAQSSSSGRNGFAKSD